MRRIFTLVLACIALNSYSQKSLRAKQNGIWDVPSTWENVTSGTSEPVTNMPQNGDIVEIPKDITVTMSNTPYPDNKARPKLTINIFGVLGFTDPGNDKLYLDQGSTIQVFAGGAILTDRSNTEIIAISTGSSDNIVWNGQPATISGPAYATSTTSGFVNSTLPIKLKSFTAQAQINRVVLKWSTAEEINNSHFEVEKSTNARQWSLIQRVAAEGQPADYTHTDAAAASSEVYYRLRSVDLDGKSEYSHIVKVGRSRSLTAYVSPNPARTQVTVSLSTASAAPLQVQLVANNGQVVREGFFAKGSSLIQLGLQGTRAGIYTLVLREGSSVIEASQLLVQ